MPELATPAPRPADPEPAQRVSSPGAIQEPDAPGAIAGAVGPGASGPGLSGHAGRDRLVLRSVQRRAGNAAAVSLVERRRAPAEIGRTPRTGSTVGGPGGPALQRQAQAAQRQAPVVQRAGAVIDGTPVTTLADLDRWYMTRVKRLQAQRTDLTSGGVGSPAPIHRAISLGQKEAAACRQDPSAELDGFRAIAAQMWLDKHYRTAHNAAEATRGRAVLARAAKLNASLGKAAGALRTQVLPTLRDAQRTQFMEGNEESLFDLADKIANVVDTSLVLKDGITAMSKTQRELVSVVNVALMNQGMAPPLNTNAWVTKIANALDTANKAYAGLQLIRAGLEMLGTGKTSAAEGRTAVKTMSTVISAGGSLLGASTPMTVYANLYVGPMVDACLDALKRLEDIGRKINRTLLENGLYDQVNWSLEPGGRPMFDFMRGVMRAGGAGEIPSPIPPEVASYLVDQADELEAGTRKDELPTTGAWFWKNLDQKWAKYWIYRNRDNLWGMFYGSLPVVR